MSQLRAISSDTYDNNAMELGSVRRAPSIPFLDEDGSGPSSLRSSLDSGYCQSQGCDVHIYDDGPVSAEESSARFSQRLNTSSWYGGLGEFEDLRECLKVSEPVPYVGVATLIISRLEIPTGLDGCEPSSCMYYKTSIAHWRQQCGRLVQYQSRCGLNTTDREPASRAYIDQEIAKIYLGGHRCLDLGNASRQALGGPTEAGKDGKCKRLLLPYRSAPEVKDMPSHMASDTDLVRGQTDAHMVLYATNSISDGRLLTHCRACWYLSKGMEYMVQSS